ncbi:mucin-15 [Xenopus laevis]|uniref:Mucin-15 n=2 Tax=Xenopus laevis TaxID=8355 RepID=A0A974CZT5_XENLA|nr:mucin-15 [Xenopus laevis]OCT81801.1 hypothetical protein XELAEV_18024309mg [Xenopus laevis]
MLLLFRLVLAFSLLFSFGYGESTLADVTTSSATMHPDTSSTMLNETSSLTNSFGTDTTTTTNEGPKSTMGLTSIVDSLAYLRSTVNESTTENVTTTTNSPTTGTNHTTTDFTANVTTITTINITRTHFTTPSTTHENITTTNLNWTSTSVNSSISPTSSNVTETLINPTPGSTNQSTAATANTSEATTTLSTYTTSNPLTATNTSDAGISGKPKDTVESAGVVLGAIIGSILGIALVSLLVYFLCGTKKGSSFSHRRLNEDIRNEPVLRLDNPVNPYDVSYGDSSYSNPTALDEFSINNHPREVIAMDDMSPPQPNA